MSRAMASWDNSTKKGLDKVHAATEKALKSVKDVTARLVLLETASSGSKRSDPYAGAGGGSQHGSKGGKNLQ